MRDQRRRNRVLPDVFKITVFQRAMAWCHWGWSWSLCIWYLRQWVGGLMLLGYVWRRQRYLEWTRVRRQVTVVQELVLRRTWMQTLAVGLFPEENQWHWLNECLGVIAFKPGDRENDKDSEIRRRGWNGKEGNHLGEKQKKEMGGRRGEQKLRKWELEENKGK